MPRTSARLALAAVAAAALAAPLAASAAAAPAQQPATYRSYALGISGGEPSIGFDRKANAALFSSGTNTKRLTWDAKNALTIADAKAPTSARTLDPIMFTDQQTNRTFVSQLVLACSLTSFTDDAGKTYTPTEGCGAGTLLDHQTLGGGPYTEGKPPGAGLAGYPNAVYYCAQNGFSGTCARSDDGGLTYGSAVPAYNTPANGAPDGGACSAIHGHLRVGPDGVVYLPNKGCGGTPTVQNLTNSEFFGGAPALSVSEDNGTTWNVRPVPGAHNQDESDPSVAADKGGLVYFGWEDGINPTETVYGTTSAAKISVTRDHGKTWSTPYDVSSALGIKNVQFPEVIAGDPGRAAFAFIGTPGVGDDQHVGFKGEWHMYVATTLDSGKSWTTVDATPNDPVQRGCISLQGTSNKTVLDDKICNQRNLLDFNDITVDREGRVLVAYSDGCTGDCVKNVTSGSKGAADMVLRQTSGPLLYAAKGAIAPVQAPVTTTPGDTAPAPQAAPRRDLAATGASAGLAVLALLLVGGALLVRRSQRR
ncbi:MAG: glycoside hydrolase [Actinobacteria bacterium]|nr:glycoside hydrolase [Actinomycetota bacterium]MCA1722285.1 glycoside hydrolase [Actinomycetota bacterium]